MSFNKSDPEYINLPTAIFNIVIGIGLLSGISWLITINQGWHTVYEVLLWLLIMCGCLVLSVLFMAFIIEWLPNSIKSISAVIKEKLTHEK